MDKLSLFILVLCTSGLRAHTQHHEPIMISDLVRSLKTPLFVISTLCWNLEKRKEMALLLNNNGNEFIATAETKTELSKYSNNNNAHQTMILADIRCPNSERLLNEANLSGLFKRPYRWIILGGEYNKSMVIPGALSRLPLLVDSDVLVVHCIDNESYIVHSLFKAHVDTFWRIEFYGEWTYANGIRQSKAMEIPKGIRRNGLQELKIRTAYVIVDNDTRNHLSDYKYDNVDTVTKLGYVIIRVLMDYMQCQDSYTFSGTWGYLVNGTWTGEMGDLTNGHADLGGTSMFFLKGRLFYVDYLICPTHSKVKIVFRQPPLSYERNLYLLAFKDNVWYTTLGLMFILLLTLYASAYWDPNRKINEDTSTGLLRASMSDIGIFILGAVCQQGSPVELKSSLGRVVMFVLFLTSTFLYTSYSANIVALRQYSTSHIRTLKDLLNSKLDVGVDDIIYNRHYFTTASEPIRKAIYKKKVAPPGQKPKFFSKEEGIKKVRQEPFAFNVELGVGYKFVEKHFYESEKCDLEEVSYLSDIEPWLTCPKNSPYREIFLIGFSRLREHGIIQREQFLLYTRKPKCTSRTGNFVSVSIIDSYPVFLILVYGALLSFTLLIFEIIAHKRGCCRVEI